MLEGCDQVTGTNEEDGVAEYLLKTFERNQLWQGYIHFFSSSKGNSSFIGNSDGGILVDAGVSCKRLCEALKANEIDLL